MIELIAEIGVNHDGDLAKAVSLINIARHADFDTVKFQLFHGDRYPKLQLNADQLYYLKEHALSLELKFLCTPDDVLDATEIKHMLGCDRIKIGSSNVTNLPLLKFISTLDMDVILSTGACTADEVFDAFRALSPPSGAIIKKRTVMHCVSAYPSPLAQLNLLMIQRLQHWDHVSDIGYSDHTVGDNYQSALVALGLGARVFEKHITLGHHMRGPDHRMSADVHEMKTYARMLRENAASLGDGIKVVQECELQNRKEYEEFVKAQKV